MAMKCKQYPVCDPASRHHATYLCEQNGDAAGVDDASSDALLEEYYRQAEKNKEKYPKANARTLLEALAMLQPALFVA